MEINIELYDIIETYSVQLDNVIRELAIAKAENKALKKYLNDNKEGDLNNEN